MSRRSRSRNRSGAVKAAPPSGYVGTSGVTYTPDQVAAMMTAQRQLEDGRTKSSPLPSSPYWETSPFGPGRRLPPAPINVPREDSGRPEPRLYEYWVSQNLQIDDHLHVPWDVLKRAADTPLFRKCIERRKSVCEQDFVVTVDPVAVAMEAMLSGSSKKDVEAGLRKKYIGDIARVSAWMQVPDRKNDMEWQDWASLLFENRLKYDAAVVYPRKTYGGDLFGLEIIDGKTIKPLLDEGGGRPLPPYPAFQQIMYGFPRGEWMATVDPDEIDPLTGKPMVQGGYPGDVMYYKKSVWRSESPYGMSATEIALLDGFIWMKRMGWIAAEYTHGVIPRGILEVGPETNWNPVQWGEWSTALNDHLRGITEARQEWPMTPPGMKFVQPAQMAEQYKPEYDLFLLALVCGDFGIPPSEIGFTQTGALGASFHEGEEDILYRGVRLPDMRWLSRYATKLCIRELGMPPALKVQLLGLEAEDEAAADAIALQQLQNGRKTLNEDRADRGEPPYDFDEADMPMLMTPRGIVFIEGASALAQPGMLIGPPQAPPAGMPGAPAEGQQDGQGDDEDSGAAGSQAGPPSGQGTAAPAAKSAELTALANWLGKARNARSTFTCKHLTKADAPRFAADPRVVFKAGDAGPKVLSPTGRAGSVTWS